MSSMRKSMLLTAMMGAIAFSGNSNPYYTGPQYTEEEKAEMRRKDKIRLMEKDGLQEFNYANGSVWARNQKNADRKAKNAGLI